MSGKDIDIQDYRLLFGFLKYAWYSKTDTNESKQHGRGEWAEGSA